MSALEAVSISRHPAAAMALACADLGRRQHQAGQHASASLGATLGGHRQGQRDRLADMVRQLSAGQHAFGDHPDLAAPARQTTRVAAPTVNRSKRLLPNRAPSRPDLVRVVSVGTEQADAERRWVRRIARQGQRHQTIRRGGHALPAKENAMRTQAGA